MSQIYTSQLIISLEPPASAGAELGECQPWAGPGAKQTKIRNLMLSKVQEAFVNQIVHVCDLVWLLQSCLGGGLGQEKAPGVAAGRWWGAAPEVGEESWEGWPTPPSSSKQTPLVSPAGETGKAAVCSVLL